MKTRPIRLFSAIFLTATWLLLGGCGRQKGRPAGATGFHPAPDFWVWHRSSALKPAELESLRSSKTRTLYWQAAECGWRDKRWDFVRISPPQPAAGGIRIVPVFRIRAEAAFLGAPDAADQFAAGVRAWRGGGAPGPVQIDFDCPARLLADYADFLTTLTRHPEIAELSATALASWPDAPGFSRFARSVSMVLPMFYDLTTDDPAAVMQGRFQAMADPGVEAWMGKWTDCPAPWIAGLPNFERVSVFGTDGRLVGHLRGWEHDSIFFHPALKALRMEHGITRFEVVKPTIIHGCSLVSGMTVVHRTCDPAVLEQLRDASRRAGAAGVVYFTLPGPGIQAAFTATHLGATAGNQAAAPAFSINTDGSITLANPGPRDLPAGLWELKLQSPHPGTFQSASPGGFVESSSPGGLPAEMSGSLTLRFSKLPAGASITSGPLVTRQNGVTWELKIAPSRP